MDGAVGQRAVVRQRQPVSISAADVNSSVHTPGRAPLARSQRSSTTWRILSHSQATAVAPPASESRGRAESREAAGLGVRDGPPAGHGDFFVRLSVLPLNVSLNACCLLRTWETMRASALATHARAIIAPVVRSRCRDHVCISGSTGVSWMARTAAWRKGAEGELQVAGPVLRARAAALRGGSSRRSTSPRARGGNTRRRRGRRGSARSHRSRGAG